MRQRGSSGSIAILAAVLALLLSACASTAGRAGQVPQPQGALVDRAPAIDRDPALTEIGATEYTVHYRSSSGSTGRPTIVSGAVFVPGGTAPHGGWPIVTVGHGTTGLTADCAPSQSRNLLGYLNVVLPLLRRGFVVTMSDYQGIGTSGTHPYLEPNSAAYNMIDAVRAARELVAATAPVWAAVGESQGGQAAWAAAEHAADYGVGLEFVGAANLSPAADLSDLMPEAGPADLTPAQQAFVPLLVAGLRSQHPSIDPSAYLRGPLLESRDLLTSCVTQEAERKFEVSAKLTSADAKPRTPGDAKVMHDWLSEVALPKRRAAGPMLVLVGADDSLIEPDWTRAAAKRSCDLGDVVEFRRRPHEGHADPAAIEPGVQWVADRFAGTPAPNSCGDIESR